MIDLFYFILSALFIGNVNLLFDLPTEENNPRYFSLTKGMENRRI